ncbi:MAG: hypothetical protein WBO15_04865 [Gammaproteobacteria bacterium]
MLSSLAVDPVSWVKQLTIKQSTKSEKMIHADMDDDREQTETRSATKPHLGRDSIVMLVLSVLAIIGIGITDFAPQSSRWYWLWMVVATGRVCIVLHWSRARKAGESITAILKTEPLIWLSVLVAVNLVYFLLHTGRLDNENTGLIVLLILALATFHAGLRLDWRLSVLGVVFGITLVLATYLEEFFWMVLLASLAVLAVSYLIARHRTLP